MTTQNSNFLQLSTFLPKKVINLIFLVTHSIVFCPFFIPNAIYAQSKIKEFSHISVEQGLSQGAVTSIVQDGYGFMWFGTRDGLNRYDGFTFTVSKQFASNSNPFSGQQISQLALGNENNLWIGTELNGISLLSLPTGRIETYKHNPSDSTSLSSNHITSVVEAKDGTVWVGTIDAGL
ncbi:MAG: two-component regulator propeller domain-containing protein, partial [Bacteroidota bacterium]